MHNFKQTINVHIEYNITMKKLNNHSYFMHNNIGNILLLYNKLYYINYLIIYSHIYSFIFLFHKIINRTHTQSLFYFILFL